MPPRRLTLGLLWLALAALLLLFALLWSLRAPGARAVDAALLIDALLLPLPALALRAMRGRPQPPEPPSGTVFLSRLNHEVRTPLHTVMGMTQLAMQTPLTPEQRDLLSRADAATHQVLGLVDDALDLARIDAGQLPLQSRPLRLEDVVAQACQRVRPLHARPDLSLVCDWADGSLLGPRGQLIGDGERLQQVLAGLLAVALRRSGSGQVQLRLAAHPSDGEGRVPLRLTVCDNGNTAADDDAGLGLALASRLVALMGGRLDLKHGPEGASLEVQLALPLDGDALEPQRLPPQRVLLAEAHAGSRDAMSALLRHLGFAAGLAASHDGETTLAALVAARQEERPFDWLLLDARLPGPGPRGAELLARLRRDHPALRIAVLASPDAAAEASHARAFGARAVLAKPLLATDLRRLFAEAPAERHPGGEAQALAGLRVLLVEDHPLNQEIAVRLLGSRGALVDTAADGQQGLDKLQAAGPKAYDLVLMDLQMPVLDGLNATRRLRALPGFETLPVLAMTAHALAEERAACLAAGMQGHIAKPLDVQRLVQELQHYQPPPPTPPVAALNLQAGLRRFDGQTALYRRTLQGFAQQYGDGLAGWQAWLDANDWTELRRAAHTLQGLAATLGAQPLHQAALALEQDAAQGDAPTARLHLQRAQDALERVLAEIEQEFAAAPDTPSGAPPPPSVGGGDIAELQRLLAQSDSRALDWWLAHGTHSALPEPSRQQIDAALAAMDFDAAAAALAKARSATA